MRSGHGVDVPGRTRSRSRARRLAATLPVLVAVALVIAVPGGGDSRAALALPAPPSSDSLQGVSCPAAGACMAVGYSVNGATTPSPLAEEWSNGSWRVLPAPDLYTLSSVSCASADSCLAVGSSGDLAASELWNGTTWRAVPVPDRGDLESALNSVSCASAGDCMAVGYFNPSNNQQEMMADQWNRHAWTQLSTPTTDPSSLNAVSCASADNCVAVGGQALLWNGHTWQLTAPLAGTMLGLSCPSVT